MKFNVGDLVRGITDNYGYTNKGMTLGEVLHVTTRAVPYHEEEGAEKIRVKILEHKEDKFIIGKEFWVYAEDFELVKESSAEHLKLSEPDIDSLMELFA